MSDLDSRPAEAARLVSERRAGRALPGQEVERIDRPSAPQPQLRAHAQFNSQVWWAIMAGIVGVVFLATGLGFQHVHNENTVTVFGQVTEQAPMAWYYDHPWFGALVLAALPAVAFACLIVTLLQTRFTANEVRTEVAELTTNLQHTGYRLQGQLDAINAQLARRNIQN